MKNNIIRLFKNYSAGLISLLFITLSGCGLWEDFTTYFNTYYNVSILFDEALSEVQVQEKEVFVSKFQVQNPPSSQKFVSVIEKCSKILQYDQNSSFVDDALIMIGKSYYYQKEYPSCIRKFNELITNFPKSKVVPEARLWIAKANSKSNETKLATTQLQELIKDAVTLDDEDLLADCYLELMKINYSEDEHEKLIKNGLEYLKYYYDGDQASQVSLQMGLSYKILKLPNEALEKLIQVADYSPTYKTTFRARIEVAKLKRETGKTGEAVNMLERLKNNPLFDEFIDQIEFELGNAFKAENNFDEAIKKYRLVDTLYSRTESAGYSQYYIAEYIENKLNNFDSAKYYYDRVAQTAAPKELIQAAQKKGLIFTKRKTLLDNIANTTKRIGELRTFKRDTTNLPAQPVIVDSSKLSDSIYLVILQSQYNNQKIADSMYTLGLKRDTIKYFNNLKIADSITYDIGKGNYELGLLYYTEMDLPDSSLKFFEFVADSFATTDLGMRANYALASYYDKKGVSSVRDSLYKNIYDNFKKGEIVNEVAKKLKLEVKEDSLLRPAKEFAKAESLYLKKDYKNSLKSLYSIFDKYPSTDYGPKALLTAGFILEEHLKLKDSAAVIYDTLNKKYPSSSYAVKINPKLMTYQTEMQRIMAEKKAEEERIKREAEALRLQDSIRVADSLHQIQLKKEEKKSQNKNGIKVPALKDSINIVPDSLKPKEEEPQKEKQEEPLQNDGKVIFKEGEPIPEPVKTDKPPKIK